MNSIIQYCKNKCENRFQDERYGLGMRVQNPTGKLEKSGKCRCSVCNFEQEIQNRPAQIRTNSKK